MKSLLKIVTILPLFSLLACTNSDINNPTTVRLKQAIQTTEAEIAKLEQRTKTEREGVYLVQSEIELAKSRLERLKERLKAESKH